MVSEPWLDSVGGVRLGS